MTASRKRNPESAGSAPSQEAAEETPRLLTRPLDALAFLLPLILFYELGCLLLASHSSEAAQDRVVAFHLLQLFFELFGSTGVWMPGLAVVAVLLGTQLVSGRPWIINRRRVALMYAESALLAVPLLVFNQILRASPGSTGVQDSLWADLVLGVGAGVYEELVFRLVLISVLVMIGHDLLGISNSTTLIAAVILSALAFSAHHHPPLGSEPFAMDRFLFRAAAGAYLGVLFVFRGYGPAAGTHAAYNVLVTLLA